MYHVSVKRLCEQPIVINCPKCGATESPATAFDQRETLNYILPFTTTWATCHACGARLYCKWSCEHLAGLSAEELEGIVVARVSLVSRFLAIAALLLCWAPGVGTVLGGIALAVNWRNRGWKRLCLIAIGISFLPWVILVLADVFSW